MTLKNCKSSKYLTVINFTTLGKTISHHALSNNSYHKPQKSAHFISYQTRILHIVNFAVWFALFYFECLFFFSSKFSPNKSYQLLDFNYCKKIKCHLRRCASLILVELCVILASGVHVMIFLMRFFWCINESFDLLQLRDGWNG